MGRRLPPGEAARRAKERSRKMWAGEHYEKRAPGAPDQWGAAARAFLNGDIYSPDLDVTPDGPTARRRPVDPNLAALGIDEMPGDFETLRRGYRKAVMTAFRAAGSKDTAPEYVAAFAAITKAYDRLKLQRGW